jgi:CBS domain-containing protein
VRIGRVFAYLMIAIGVLELFTGGVANGIWLAFIGWFLLSAASSEEAGVTVKTLLRSVPASAAMSSPVVTVPDWITVEQFITGVAPSHPFTTYPVRDPSGKLTGVIRLPDMVRVPRADQGTARLIEFAQPIASVPVTWPEEELATMIQRLGGAVDQRVLVFDKGELAGIISPADIARLLTIRQRLSGPSA